MTNKEEKLDEKVERTSSEIHIGGSVGGGSAIGTGASIKAGVIIGGGINSYNETGPKTVDEFLAILNSITEQLESLKSEILREDLGEVKDLLARISEMSTRETPPVDRIAHYLEIGKNIIENAGKVGTGLAVIIPLFSKAIESLPSVFGK